MCFIVIDNEVKSLELDNDDLLDDEIDENTTGKVNHSPRSKSKNSRYIL